LEAKVKMGGYFRGVKGNFPKKKKKKDGNINIKKIINKKPIFSYLFLYNFIK
jgi:hypothetical protein